RSRRRDIGWDEHHRDVARHVPFLFACAGLPVRVSQSPVLDSPRERSIVKWIDPNSFRRGSIHARRLEPRSGFPPSSTSAPSLSTREERTFAFQGTERSL